MVLEAHLFEYAIQLAMDGQDAAVRKEAIWVLSNAAMSATAEQIDQMTKMGAVQALCSAFAGTHDSGMVKCALDALEMYFKAGERRQDIEGGENIYCHIVEECKGVDKLEDLQEDENVEVYTKAVNILSTYFNTEEEADTEPETQPAQFNFASF